MTRISLIVDGQQVIDDVEPRMLLVQYLREVLGKTGTVVGCDTSNCGACTVHLDGQSVKSCNVLAVQADGGEVTTIEGLAKNGELHPVQQAFHECHGLQCGYCTPGMIMQAIDLLNDEPGPVRGGDPARSRGQPVPMHRLPQHREVRAARGEGRTRRGGDLMTATQEPPAAEIGRDRRRKEDQRLITGRTRWTDNMALPGMLHLAMVRSPFAHATIRASTPRPPRHARTWSTCSPGAEVADSPGRHRERLAAQRRAEDARPTRRWPSTGSPSPARSWPWWWPGPRPRRGTRPIWSTWSTTNCPPRST